MLTLKSKYKKVNKLINSIECTVILAYLKKTQFTTIMNNFLGWPILTSIFSWSLHIRHDAHVRHQEYDYLVVFFLLVFE